MTLARGVAVGLSIVVGALPAAVSAQVQLRRGGEFRVNTYTTGSQVQPAVAVGPDGNFVVAWQSTVNYDHNVYVRRFDAGGAPIGPEQVVNAWTTGDQRSPAVAATREGAFVVVWTGQGPGESGVFGRVINALGNPIGEDFPVNSYRTGSQLEPAIASDAEGNVTVVWSGNGGAWDFDGVSARRFTSLGLPLTPQIDVNTWIAGVQSRPAVASTPEGDFTVMWQGDPQNRVFARRFTDEGVPLSGQFVVNMNAYAFGGPALASDPDGHLFLASAGADADGNVAGVNGLRLGPDGSSSGGEFVVNSYTLGAQWEPSVAAYGGSFIVVWTSAGQDGSFDGVYGQRYDGNFERIGTEFRINSYTTLNQQQPAVASDAKGNWTVAWTGGDGAGSGIFAQQYAPDVIFDNNFETDGLAAWSASSADGGDLAVTTGAALNGLRGLQGVVDDTEGLWVQDSTPADEPRYRARFYFDTNGFDPGEALDRRRVMLFVAFEENPVRRLVLIILRRLNGAYSVRGSTRLDDNTKLETPFVPITDGPHFVEFDWRRATSPDAQDGRFALWVDGGAVYANSSVDNALSAVDFVRMGAITVKAGASGTLYWDHFRSRRSSAIGSF